MRAPVVARPSTLRRDAQAALWEVAAGMAAGGLVGALVAGPLARLLMLLLRLTSPPGIAGLTSDDGFVIGRVTAETLQLVAISGAAGGLAGVGYIVARRTVPIRWLRLTLWTLLAAAVGGGFIVHTDGVDFQVLEPLALAVAGFVLLPAVGALTIGIVADRFALATPGRNRATAVMIAGVLAAALALPAAALAAVVMTAIRRLPPAPWLAPFARGIALVLAAALFILGASDLIRDIAALA